MKLNTNIMKKNDMAVQMYDNIPKRKLSGKEQGDDDEDDDNNNDVLTTSADAQG